MARRSRLLAPRLSAPDLPAHLEDGTPFARGGDFFQMQWVSLAAARITDLLVADCTTGTLDLPQATVARTAFADCRADEVDTRSLRAMDLDLRDLEAGFFVDAASLRGVTLSSRQVEFLAPALAVAVGIHVLDRPRAARESTRVESGDANTQARSHSAAHIAQENSHGRRAHSRQARPGGSRGEVGC